MGRPRGSLNKNREPDVEIRCEHCAAAFKVRPWRIRQGVRFCGVLCQRRGTALKRKRFGPDHFGWKNGRGSYRERAIAHHGAVCDECGYDAHETLLWVHHRNFKSRVEQDDHSLENLQVLCIRCHLEKHLAV